MSEVKRYVTTCDCMSEASWGDYVRHADYAALAAECERLQRDYQAASRTEGRDQPAQGNDQSATAEEARTGERMGGGE